MGINYENFLRIKYLNVQLLFILLFWLLIINIIVQPMFVQSHGSFHPNVGHWSSHKPKSRLAYILNRSQNFQPTCGQLKSLWNEYLRSKSGHSKFINYLNYLDLISRKEIENQNENKERQEKTFGQIKNGPDSESENLNSNWDHYLSNEEIESRQTTNIMDKDMYWYNHPVTVTWSYLT